ncbi:hypothetical protein D1BOALGB6SA_1996 [Olavius sp. associated proteobacterium Delta 1]|nr:hypothetical protein D1BOALGB6SA_1996 [Olavius sp. associated proteobacterium Delta 1]
MQIEYLWSASGGSIIKKTTIKTIERSDFHNYSIYNIQ